MFCKSKVRKVKLLIGMLALLMMIQVNSSMVRATEGVATDSNEITLSSFYLGSENYVTGSYKGAVAKIRLQVNGQDFTLIPVTNNEIRYYAKDKILNLADNAQLICYDAKNNIIEAKKIQIVDATSMNGKVTPINYYLDTDSRVTGVYSGAIKSIAIRINDVLYGKIPVPTDETFSYYTKNLITKPEDKVEILAYNASGVVVDTTIVTVKQTKDTKGTITPETYMYKTDARVVGTYTEDVKKIGLEVNGILKQVVSVTGEHFSYYAKDKIISGNDDVFIVAFDKSNKVLDRQSVVLEIPFVVDDLYDNEKLLKGTATPKSTLKIKLNYSDLAEIKADSQGAFSYDIGLLDRNLNKITVERIEGGMVKESKYLTVKDSGKVDYLDKQYFSGAAVRPVLSNVYTRAIPERYKELRFKYTINALGRVYYEKEVSVDENGNIAFTLPNMLGAFTDYDLLSHKLFPSMEFKLVGKDRRYFEVYDVAGQLTEKYLKVTDLVTESASLQIKKDNELTFSGVALPGAKLTAYIGGHNFGKLTYWTTKSQPLSTTPIFENRGNFSFTANGNAFLKLTSDSKNVPYHVEASPPYPYYYEEVEAAIGVYNQDLNAPPHMIILDTNYSTLEGIGIPNSSVKIKIKGLDYQGIEREEEYVVQLDKYGHFKLGSLYAGGSKSIDTSNSEPTISVTNTAEGVSGRENTLKGIQYPVDDDGFSIPHSYLIYQTK